MPPGVAHGGVAAGLAYAEAPVWLIVFVVVAGIVCSAVANFPAWSRDARPEIEQWLAFIARHRH
jgi:hypothetical protein